jgi:hypothetical protein
MLNNKSGELYSDINSFKNSKGFEISTANSEVENNPQGSIAILLIRKAPKEIINLYVKELTSQLRESTKAANEPKTLKNIVNYQSPYFVNSGGTLYTYAIKDGDLYVIANNNINAISLVTAARLNSNSIKVTPWSNNTDIHLSKGDVISFNVSGSVKLGDFLGYKSADGLKGYQSFSVYSRFNHGSLIGKIGDGDWFFIGKSSKITAQTAGHLRLMINDKDRANNDGFFNVRYSIN